MQTLQPDAVVRLRFLKTDEGGRRTPVPPGGMFGCPFGFEGEYFDCRLLLQDLSAAITPGDTVDVPLKFLWPERVKPRLRAGSACHLWEGKVIADGVVSQVIT